MMKLKIAILVVSALSLCACQGTRGKKQLRDEAREFADAFYNYQFDKCLQHCTPESEPWLRFAASNVHEADVRLLSAQETDATVEIDDISIDDGDSSATVHMTIHDFLAMDTVGKAGHMVGTATVSLPMTRRNGQWKISLTSFPKTKH